MKYLYFAIYLFILSENITFGWIFGVQQELSDPKASNCDECGLPNKRVKIVGGQSTTKNEYPWVVSIHDSGDYVTRGAARSQFCGGVIIARNWVLTAAHCTADYVKKPLMMVIGVNRHNLGSFFDSFVLPKIVASVTIHPKYNPKNQEFDAALIELVLPITFSDIVRPICLVEADANIVGKKMVVVGWGSTSEGGPASEILQEVEVEGMSNDKCNNDYKDFSVPITDNMICAGHSSGGKDACQGDSGGPLMQKCGDRYMVIGLVSFGIGCAQAQFPGIYTKVYNIKSWIEKTTNREKYCQYNCQRFASDVGDVNDTVSSTI